MTISIVHDRLLFFTRLALTLLMALTIFAAVAALLTMPILFFRFDRVSAEMAASDPKTGPPPDALQAA